MPDRVKEKLVELLGANTCKHDCCEDCEYCEDRDACISYLKDSMADHLIANGVTVQECPRPLEEWHENYGNVLWWKFPIEEPPYVGSPLDVEWPAYHTHWTPVLLPLPQPPKGE